MRESYPYNEAALRWLEALLSERFGGGWKLRLTNGRLELRCAGLEGLVVFDSMREIFAQPVSTIPCTSWSSERNIWPACISEPLPAPGLSELPGQLIEITGRVCYVKYDILGLVYWMLARIEEVGRIDLDCHQRFPAKASHAFRNAYLDRPIVDEWLLVLAKIMKRVWPALPIKSHVFTIRLSHDVDMPSRYAFANARTFLGRVARDLLGGNARSALLAPWIRAASSKRIHRLDPVNTFDWIMDNSEKRGLRSTFYFLCGRTNSKYDGDYDIGHPAILHLIKRIHLRGHLIGLHPSYDASLRCDVLQSEYGRLKDVCSTLGIEQPILGGRMHYLRWQHPATLLACNAIGLSYDSTLGYADQAGFRCGTCHPYQGFDPVLQQALELRIYPLIAMESSVMQPKYMGNDDPNSAMAVFDDLKQACKRVNGCFDVLWHNTSFMGWRKDVYTNCLR